MAAAVEAVGARFSVQASSRTLDVERHRARRRQRRFQIAGQRHQRQRQPLDRRHQRHDFLGVSAVGNRQHRVARQHHAQIAVQRLRRMQEHRRRARRRKRRRDLPPDQSGLAHARDDHAPLARQQQLDRLLEFPVQPLRQRLNRFRLDPQNAPRRLQTRRRIHRRFPWRAHRALTSRPAGRPRTHQLPDRVQLRQQRRQAIQRQRIRSIGFRPRRIVMHFDEHSVHSHGACGARQRLDEFRLSAAGVSLLSRQLHRMRHVKNHRASRPGQDRKRAHIRHQVVVSERRPALGQDHPAIPRAAHLFHRVRPCPTAT